MKITVIHLRLKSTEYDADSSALANRRDPKKADIATSTTRGMKKLFLIKPPEGCPEITVSQNFAGVKTIFLIPLRKKLKFIKNRFECAAKLTKFMLTCFYLGNH